MDNVVQFPGRINDNKNIDPEAFNRWLESCNFPDLIHNIVKQLPHSSYLDHLPHSWWDVTSWGKGQTEEDGLECFGLASSLRRQIVPEFGTQSYTDYAWITYGYADEEPDSQAMPNNLMEQLSDYFNSYPEVICPNTLMCIALLAQILDQPDVRYIETNRTEDQFFVMFYEAQSIEGRYMKFVFGCDFLPMILDDAAIALQHRLDN